LFIGRVMSFLLLMLRIIPQLFAGCRCARALVVTTVT
jgi:hypothetical protein